MESGVRALRHFNRTLKINLDRVEVYTNIGLFLLKNGRMEKTFEFFPAIIEEQPNHVQTYANLESIREARGNTRAANRIYCQSLERNPDYHPVRQSFDRLLSDED